MSPLQRTRGVARARAALAGNPSDGYGGAVLAVTLPPWAAQAEAEVSRRLVIDPPNPLVEATVRRFARELDQAALGTYVRWSTSIPQRVGLGSSSALVIAVLRALCRLYGARFELGPLAEFALSVETEDLGIVAGLQDRVAQVYGGLTFMDFGAGGVYESLDPGLLPPLLIAWRHEAAADSGDVHASLHERHRAGEESVLRAMTSLAAEARRARDALLERDHAGFAEGVDATFNLRRAIIELDPRCMEMVETARRFGAAANYTGSGGAIVAVSRERSRLDQVSRALTSDGCDVFVQYE